MIVNYASSSVNKLKASLNDDARVVIYDRHMFIVQATESMDNDREVSGLYYKHIIIVNDDSSVIIKWSSKLIDAARGVIYDHHMFIV